MYPVDSDMHRKSDGVFEDGGDIRSMKKPVILLATDGSNVCDTETVPQILNKLRPKPQKSCYKVAASGVCQVAIINTLLQDAVTSYAQKVANEDSKRN